MARPKKNADPLYDRKFSKAESLVLERIDENTCRLLSLNDFKVYEIDSIAAEIYVRLAEGATGQKVLERLSRERKLPFDQLSAAYAKFVRFLLSEGLLVDPDAES